jgi:hypothetical protein
MNELSAQARKASNPGAAVALLHKSYGILLSGHIADPEKGRW